MKANRNVIVIVLSAFMILLFYDNGSAVQKHKRLGSDKAVDIYEENLQRGLGDSDYNFSPPFPSNPDFGYYSDEPMHFSSLSAEQKKVVYFRLTNCVCVIASNKVVQYEIPCCSGKYYSYEKNSKKLTELCLFMLNTRVTGIISKNAYLVEDNGARLDIYNDVSYVDNQIVNVLARMVGTFDYTTVLGARRRVPHYEAVERQDLTPLAFVDFLKKGEVFYVALDRFFTCPECQGRGKVNRNDGKIGTIDCSICQGKGKLMRAITYKVVW